MKQTALHFAAYVGRPPVVELLLAASADGTAREAQFEKTAAEWALETGEDELAKLIEKSPV